MTAATPNLRLPSHSQRTDARWPVYSAEGRNGVKQSGWLHEARIPRRRQRHRHSREDVGNDVGVGVDVDVVECGINHERSPNSVLTGVDV